MMRFFGEATEERGAVPARTAVGNRRILRDEGSRWYRHCR
jgi:hypothetical protein